MGGFNTKLQGQCNSDIMKGDAIGASGQLSPINCSSVGRFRGMWMFGILCFIYFVTALVYGIMYGDRTDFDIGTIIYLVYNGIASLLCIYLIYTGFNGYSYTYHKATRDDDGKIIKKRSPTNPFSWFFPSPDYGDVASPGYDYRSDAPFIGSFEKLQKGGKNTKGELLNFKQLMLELGCSTDLEATTCKLFDIRNPDSLEKLKQVVTPGGNLVVKDPTSWKTNIDAQNKGKVKSKQIQYVFKKRGLAGIKQVDPKWNSTINNLSCKHKSDKNTCESSFDKDSCVWVEAKSKGNNLLKPSYCKKKWEWFTGADIMACDECDSMSPYCTLKYTSMIGFFGFLTITLLMFVGLIQVESGFTDTTDKENTEQVLNDINISLGWSLWSILVFVTYIYFMLWFTCPAGSDLGNEGIDDVGYVDHFRMAWKLLTFPFLRNEGDSPPTYGIIIIVLILIGLILTGVLVPFFTLQ